MRHFSPTRFNRRSTRLKGFDYSQPGEYFVTVNTHGHEHLFGEVIDGEMRLNAFGRIAREEWLRTSDLRPHIFLDEFIIMPNHMHGMIIIHEKEINPPSPIEGAWSSSCTGAARCARTTKESVPFHVASDSLGAIVRSFKSASSRMINELRGIPGAPIWHRNYYDRIIRSEKEFENIQQYIIENPLRWAEDRNRRA